MTSDYQRGFDDGQATARSKAEALKGPDRTMYECIGGPHHGKRIETGGGMYIRAAVIPPMDYAYRDFERLNAQTIRTGEYKREVIAQSGYNPRPRTVYVWQGVR